MKLKAFFIIFKELSVVRNCLRPESGQQIITTHVLFPKSQEVKANRQRNLVSK